MHYREPSHTLGAVRTDGKRLILLDLRQKATGFEWVFVDSRYMFKRCPLSPQEQLHSVAHRYRRLRFSQTSQQQAGRTTGSSANSVQDGPRSTCDPRLQRLEAILFLAREPVSTRRLSKYADLADATEARTLVRQLNQIYQAAGRAFQVEEIGGGLQLMTRREFAPWLHQLGNALGPTRLSAPAMETLAVVAYRQPVLRAEIEAIRGVGCGEVLRQLIERDFVRIGGRSEELGRPYLYSTTKRFLQIFGLRSLEDLPRREIMRSQMTTDLAKAVLTEPESTSDLDLKPSAPSGNRENEEESSVTIATLRETDQEELKTTTLTYVEQASKTRDSLARGADDEFDEDELEDEDDLEEDDDEEDDEFDDEEDEELDDEDEEDEDEEDEDEEDDDDEFDDEDDLEEDDDDDDDEFEDDDDLEEDDDDEVEDDEVEDDEVDDDEFEDDDDLEEDDDDEADDDEADDDEADDDDEEGEEWEEVDDDEVYEGDEEEYEDEDWGEDDDGEEDWDAGDGDAGDGDAGDKDAGDGDAGDEDAGDEDAGDEDAGDEDAGDEDAGDK
jgi:segregation and condensation protein B